MAGEFDDLMDSFFGPNKFKHVAEPKKVEKSQPWAAKIINGKYYVPLEQVVDLLKENDILPAVRRGIEVRIANLEAQKDLDL